MRPRIKIQGRSVKIYNSAASEEEAKALSFRRFEQSMGDKKYYVLFFGEKHYINESEASDYKSKGYAVYVEQSK